jgi:hypothetical protein
MSRSTWLGTWISRAAATWAGSTALRRAHFGTRVRRASLARQPESSWRHSPARTDGGAKRHTASSMSGRTRPPSRSCGSCCSILHPRRLACMPSWHCRDCAGSLRTTFSERCPTSTPPFGSMRCSWPNHSSAPIRGSGSVCSSCRPIRCRGSSCRQRFRSAKRQIAARPTPWRAWPVRNRRTRGFRLRCSVHPRSEPQTCFMPSSPTRRS